MKVFDLLLLILIREPIRQNSLTIPVALVGSALPHLEGPESLKSFDGTLREITRAVEPYFPEFRNFIEICKQGHWLETHNYSAGSGGAWCVEVPYDQAVVVYVVNRPNINDLLKPHIS